MALIIGINSGSSADGVDAVLADIELADDGQPTRPAYRDGISIEWPEPVAELIWKGFAGELSMVEVARLNYIIGAVFAEVTMKLLDKVGLNSQDIDVVGVDGQQLFLQQPDHHKIADRRAAGQDDRWAERWLEDRYAFGLQIGDGALLANLTNITCVTNFRHADHALGGNGAPLMQYLDYIYFRDVGHPVLTLNIGGIANVHRADSDRRRMIAFDTGPGNIMLDHVAKTRFGQPYDRDGAIAARGQVNAEVMEELLRHPYFLRRLPRSAWRSDFDEAYADRVATAFPQVSDEDLMATFAAFAAECIVRNLVANVPDAAEIGEMVASGGGVRNQTLMREIQARLPEGMRLVLSDAHGIPAQFKEALKFATLAFGALNFAANNIPAACHAVAPAILGKVSYAPRYARGTQDMF